MHTEAKQKCCHKKTHPFGFGGSIDPNREAKHIKTYQVTYGSQVFAAVRELFHVNYATSENEKKKKESQSGTCFSKS